MSLMAMSCLPDIPPTDGHHDLVIVLTTLQRHAREFFESILQDWSDSSSKGFVFVYCIDNRFQRQLEQLRREGSIGQIYDIATDASSLGWKRLIIVDSLTREQLTGDVRPGRSRDVSVVYVQIDETKGHGLNGKSGEELHVTARRMHILYAQKALTEQKSLSFNISRKNQERRETPQEYYDAGILLYDPSKSVHDKSLPSDSPPDPTADTINQVFLLQPPLPPEVTLKIREFAQEELELEDMTAAPAKLPMDSKQRHVHSLVPMSVKEIKHLEDLYNEKLRASDSDVTCTIHPWTASRPANRRDLWRLCQRYFHANRHAYSLYSLFWFAGWPGWQKDTEIGMLQCFYECPQPTRRVTIEQAVKAWQAFHGSPSYGSNPCGPYDDPAFELILDPHARFFHDPPPFLSLNSSTMAVPVFFLTSHITEEESDVIKLGFDKPEKFDERLGYPEIIFVEWHSNEDGSVEDMWRLLWQCSSYRADGKINTALFVDKQTASDNRVVVANVMYKIGAEEIREPVFDASYGSCTGMQHGRQPLEEATTLWCNLKDVNVNLEDFFGLGPPHGRNEGMYTWFRPDIVWRSSGSDALESS